MSHSSTELYDALAPYYREYAESRSTYLAAVDRYIMANICKGAESFLDVGAGDGIRAMSIARELGITYTVLCDNSAEMAAKCREAGPSVVWQFPAEKLPGPSKQFDVITCLWNVLGHLATRPDRVQALRGMRGLLKEGGTLFIDVNNRHNAPAYGWLKVFGRSIYDALYSDETRGDASFDWRIGDKIFPAMGHLFTPAEIEGIIKDSGLKIKKRVAVDYATGRISAWPWKGQLLFMLGK